jgi:putative flippase GtrA
LISFIRRRIHRLWEHSFLRFLFIGGINTLFGYGVFALFIFLGLHYSIAAIISTIAGVLFNYYTIGTFVFTSGKNYSKLFRFIIVYAVSYGLNVFFIFILIKAGLSSYSAGALLLLPMAVIVYFINKIFVFIR